MSEEKQVLNEQDAKKAEVVYDEEKIAEECKKNGITNEMIEKAIEKKNAIAEKLLDDPEGLEKTLKKFEDGLGAIPIAGHLLKDIPVAIQMIRSYAKKEYREVPIKTIVAVLSGMLYVISPVDLVPDILPGIGFLDDIAVIGFVLMKVHEDVKAYRIWKETNEKN